MVPRSSYGMSVTSTHQWDINYRVQTYHVIAHGDEEIEEQSSAFFHLHLHGAAPLESVPAPNYESEVMGSQLGVIIGRMGVGISGRGEDGADLDARLEALFT
jgi:hypothetical protein